MSRALRSRLVDRITRGVMAGLKAKRPPETMADIPASTRMAARRYIECIRRMERSQALGGSREWQRMDTERWELHDKLLNEFRKIGMDLGGDVDPEQLVQDIVKRKWRRR